MMDEAFFTHAQVAAMFPGVTEAELVRLFKHVVNDTWPAALPEDFDHILLRRVGLSTEQYTLLAVEGGWKVYTISELVDNLVDGSINFHHILLGPMPT